MKSRCVHGQGSSSEDAFTLVEMLVVIGIIVLIASMTVPAMMPFFRGQSLNAGARVTKASLFHARSVAIARKALAAACLWNDGSIQIIWDANRDGDLTMASDGTLSTDDEQAGRTDYLPESIAFKEENPAPPPQLQDFATNPLVVWYGPTGVLKQRNTGPPVVFEDRDEVVFYVTDAAGSATHLWVIGPTGQVLVNAQHLR